MSAWPTDEAAPYFRCNRVVIVGGESCVSAMVENNHVTRRYSALADRLVTMNGL